MKQRFSSILRMRRFASWFAIASVAVLVMVPLAACGGSSGSGSSSGTSATSSGPVNLTYWAWIPGMDKASRAFQSISSQHSRHGYQCRFRPR